jgi:Cdc6-like AAA superfamily ATPase
MEQWLQYQDPITQREQDLLGFAPIADRVARRIAESPRETVGIFGPFGCGKSSLIALVRERLRELKTNRIWTCTVDGWGLADGQTASAHILRKAVEEIGRHVDALSVAGIPQEYKCAIGAAGGFWFKFAERLVGDGPCPMDAIRRIDSVLHAVRATLVVFLEDLDRSQSDELLNEVVATLDRLRQMEHMSFVLAVHRASKVDFTRLCRWTETIGPLPLRGFVQ